MKSTLDFTVFTNETDDFFSTSSNIFPRYSIPVIAVALTGCVYYLYRVTYHKQ